MKNSLLYPYKSLPGSLNQSLTDLHIEIIVNYLVPTQRKQGYVIDVLTRFETNPEIITFRQEVFKDVLKNDKTVERLMRAFENLEAINERYKTLKYQFGLFRGKFEIPLDVLNDSMNDFALLILDLMDIYKKLDLIIETMDLSSKGFLAMKDYIESKTTNLSFNEMTKFFKEFINKSPYYEIGITGDDNMLVQRVECLESFPKRPGMIKRNNSSEQVLFTAQSYAFFHTVYAYSRLNLYNVFENIFNQLFQPLYNYQEEMPFIEFAIALAQLSSSAYLKICFPEITTNNEIRISSLYDLGLSVKAMKEEDRVVTVFPNDCILDEKDAGRIIMGANNSGKTVFLRSVGIAQVLFQAGLFICATDATLAIRNQLVTFLSSKEIHTKAGGRFEKEVYLVSKLIDVIDNNSLILMNEIFQSTSLEAGVEALYDILSFFTLKRTKWFVVTHLRSITDCKANFIEETSQSFSVLKTRIEDGRYYIEEGIES